MANERRILIVSEAHLIKTFVQTVVLKIIEETNAQYDCLITTPVDEDTKQSLQHVFKHVFVNEYPKGILNKLPKTKTMLTVFGLKKVVRTLPDYDIVHIQFHFFYYSFIAPTLRKKAKKFFITFFGSDFYALGRFQHILTQRSVRFADGVFAINDSTLQQIITRYKLNEYGVKSGILVFLMNNLVSFGLFLKTHTVESAREIWHFNKKVIVCGYSAGAIMRHSIIIDALKRLAPALSGYQMIFPMTYGWRGEENRAMAKASLQDTPLDYCILDQFLPVEKLQALRLAADVFINVPKTDQLAASMLEHLAAGTVVITGKWLPYASLLEKGVYLIMMNSPEELPVVLSEVLHNLDRHKEKSKANRSIVLDMVSWDSIRVNWYKYYELEQKS